MARVSWCGMWPSRSPLTSLVQTVCPCARLLISLEVYMLSSAQSDMLHGLAKLTTLLMKGCS